jgi:hypothetical protein
MYNDCVRDACGNNGYTQCIARNGSPAACKAFANGYEKCWPKSGGDKAIASCEREYKSCQTADSGLQARAMDMFAGLRVELEKNILNWEKILYDLRDKMADMCVDGTFDQRSLKCVYTVGLFADKDGKSTLFASRKLHGESSYTCNPDEFGIDITTFKENAYRLTRSQTGASSAMMGAGLGVAAGAISSGAIGRATDVQKAESALADAKSGQNDNKQSDQSENKDADGQTQAAPPKEEGGDVNQQSETPAKPDTNNDGGKDKSSDNKTTDAASQTNDGKELSGVSNNSNAA